MTTTAICKAKDPNLCPYHGAVLRMYEAQKTGDVQAYFEARTIVEAKEKEKWSEEEFAEAISKSTLPELLVEQKELSIVNAKDLDDNPDFQYFPASVRSFDPDFPEDKEGLVFNHSSEYKHDFPYHIRIQANRELNAADVEKFASMLGYAYRQTVAGESLGWPVRDSKRSFYVHADTTKGRTDDVGMALERMEEIYSSYVDSGTPPRVRKDNTRAIEGFNDPNLEFHIYYD